MDVAIVGYGAVGKEIEKEMLKKGIDDIYTIDKDITKNANFKSVSEFTRLVGPTSAIGADVYIICVWSQEQVLDVVKETKLRNKPLISIETTCVPGTYQKVKEIVKERANVVVFPERWNPNDMNHGIFNQPRVMGGDYEAGRKFYLRYMLWENIIIADKPELAELCKIVENAYRYVTIAIAEELKMLIGENYDELRRLCNSKWNIELKEARDGIDGACLPKDFKLFNEIFPKNTLLFKFAHIVNEEYVRRKKEPIE